MLIVSPRSIRGNEGIGNANEERRVEHPNAPGNKKQGCDQYSANRQEKAVGAESANGSSECGWHDFGERGCEGRYLKRLRSLNMVA